MNTIYSKEELIEAIKNGSRFSFTFFWGHRSTADSGVGPSCMSQWFSASFKIDDTTYATAEHYMMAEKAKLFKDEKLRSLILEAASPNEAKGLGRKIKNFDEEVWCANRFEIVVKGSIEKFSQNPRLGNYLKSTAPTILVEASPVDAIWGIGLHRDDPSAGDPASWNGLNLLGFALMKARDTLLSK